MSQYSNHYAQDEQDAPEADDGFHDHALSELYRAAEDLSPWYDAAALGKLIAARFARLAVERAVVAYPETVGEDPIPLTNKVA